MSTHIESFAVGQLPCRYCGVPVGERCRAPSGAIAAHTHTSRVTPVQAVWSAGFESGQADILSALERWGSDSAYIKRARRQYRFDR